MRDYLVRGMLQFSRYELLLLEDVGRGTPPLETVAGKLLKTQKAEKTQVCAVAIAECELAIVL
jgi:hypothetical protein